MDRIELIPKDVRGGGNITQSHDSMVTDEQVSIYKSTLTRYNGDSDSSYLPYYRVIRSVGVNLLWNPPRVTDDNVVHVSVNFVYASNNLPVMYSEVILDLRDSDNEVLWTASGTIMDGALSFSIEIMEDFPSVCFWNVNVSHSTYGHVHDSRRMVLGSVTNFDAFASAEVIQRGDVSYLIGTVTGTTGEGNVFGVPGQTVNFYEQWTPGLRVSATPEIIQSGDETSVKAQLIDTSDGSLVREAEHTVNLYIDDTRAPVPTTLDFTANMNILSYADGQHVSFVAHVYDQYGEDMTDQTVVFKKNGVVFDTDDTSWGAAFSSYQSEGAGDVVFTAECGNLQETYEVIDALYYNSGTISTTTVIPINNLTTDFEMSWKTRRIDNNSHAYMKFGSSESHVIYGGIITQEGSVGLYRYQNNSNQQGGMITGYNIGSSDTLVTMKHENGVASISFDGHSTSFTNTVLTDRQYIRADIPNSSGVIKELLIKPL